VDEFGGVWLRHGGDYGEESLHLDLTMGTEASGDPIEIGVVVAGMADELEGAGFRKGREYLGKSGACEIPGGGDAQSPVGGVNVGKVKFVESVETRPETVEEGELHTAFETSVRELLREGRLEGVADGGDGGVLEDTEKGASDGREEVGMFVGVDVSDVYAGALELLNLSESFAFDVIFTDGAAEESLNKI